MIEPSMSDVILRISLQRNLDATLETFKEIDIPVWQRLLEADPVEFFSLAAQGYKTRQKRRGREAKRQELDDFQRQFIAKFYYVLWRDKAAIPSRYADKLMFELD